MNEKKARTQRKAEEADIIAAILYYGNVALRGPMDLQNAIFCLKQELNPTLLNGFTFNGGKASGQLTFALDVLRSKRTVKPNIQKKVTLTNAGKKHIENEVLPKFTTTQKKHLEKLGEKMNQILTPDQIAQ